MSKKNISLDVISAIQQCSSKEELFLVLNHLNKKSKNDIYLALIWQHKNNNGKKPQYKYMEDTYKLLINSELGGKAYFIGNLKFYCPIIIMTITILFLIVFRYYYISHS